MVANLIPPHTASPRNAPMTANQADSPPSPKMLRLEQSRNPHNTFWGQQQKHHSFLSHLRAWSLHHDSSNYFNGSITVSNPDRQKSLELGKSVLCTISSNCCNTIKTVNVRLFGPHKDGSYALFVKVGAGWFSAKQYFDKEHFSHLQNRHNKPTPVPTKIAPTSKAIPEPYTILESKPAPDTRNKVVCRPLFRPFCRLPIELQEEIFAFAIGKTEHRYFSKKYVNKVRGHHNPAKQLQRRMDAIFRISKTVNEHLIPWIYSTIDFHFRFSQLTHFMYQAGPANRRLIKKLTLAYSSAALLHCVRWFAPDPIFELFDPEVQVSPSGMWHFWRCQLQDLARELHLTVLTIDICDMPTEDIPFVTRLLQQSFGSIKCVRFTYGKNAIPLDHPDLSLYWAREHWTWGQFCRDAFLRYRHNPWRDVTFGKERKAMPVEKLEHDMEGVEFFASTPYRG